jgi:polysaccharide export outer membrane protein
MRVTRSFLLLMAVALAAAGCARQPLPPLPVAAVPVAAPQVVQAAPIMAPAGIDTMVYGSVAPRAAAPMPVQVAVPVTSRGLFMTGAGPDLAPRYAPATVNRLAYAPVAPPEAPYTLDSGDRLRVVVFGQDGLSNSYVVDASGHIAMPLIGSVLARGATTDELSNRIGDKLRQGYVKEPHVAVDIEAYRPFFILGEVTQPGQYPYVADMTVETAVAIAGGFGPRAYRDTVTVTRTLNGQQVRLTVPVSFPLRPGDTVNVGERWF